MADYHFPDRLKNAQINEKWLAHRCLNAALKKLSPSLVNPQMLGSFILAISLSSQDCGCRQALLLDLFTSASAELLTPLFCKYRIKSQPQIDSEALHSFNQRRHLISKDKWKHLGECARPPFFIFNEPVIRACKHYVWYSCWSYCKYKGHLVLLRQFTAVVESVVWVNVETVNIPICRSSSIRPEVMGAMDGCLSSDVALLNTSHVFSRVWAYQWDRHSVIWA